MANHHHGQPRNHETLDFIRHILLPYEYVYLNGKNGSVQLLSWQETACKFNEGETMNADALRAMQAPLKEKYKSDPAAAVVTFHAEARMAEGIACSIGTRQAIAEAGLHPATGGDGSQLCSGDMLLEALTACAGVTLQAVSTAMGIHLNDFKVHADGDLDFRGTLGVSKEAPVGFQDIKLTFELDTDADDPSVDKLIHLTERYCVVLQTLQHPPAISVARINA